MPFDNSLILMANANVMTKKSGKKTYSYEEALQQSINYFGGDELAASSWLNKYAMKDKSGAFLEADPDEMHRRMAREFSRIESAYSKKPLGKVKHKELSAYGQQRGKLDAQKIYNYFKNFKYIIPQGSVMSSLGNDQLIASLSNCIVLPQIYDSYGGILYTDQQLAQLFKRRCGVGIDISSLRPSGLFVKNAAVSTSGAVSFMDRFSNTTREVAQNGRRGALMITLDVSHPDVEKFVTSKQDLDKITGANISVRISDAFMKAVCEDADFTLRFPAAPAKPSYSKTIRATDLWNTITSCAHRTAEPGIIFWDHQHHYSTSSVYPGFKNISTNPCSEIAMQGGDSCRLIALNLFSFVDKPFTKDAGFDYTKFSEVVYEAQRLMDDLVDLEMEAITRILEKIEKDPEPDKIKEVEKETWKLILRNGKSGRRTGLGFTALGDTLAALEMKFDTENALQETERIMRTKCRAEFESSIDLAIERGSFKDFDSRIEQKSTFVLMLRKEFPEVYKRMMKWGRRNISISTVAPTGTLSLLTQSSSGIEPVFMLSYKRRKKINAGDVHARVDFRDKTGDIWQEFEVYHPKLKQWMEISGEKNILRSPYAGSTAQEINWKKRIDLQSVVQKYVTHSISSTINLAATVSVEEVKEIYLYAWKKGLKGITVYREGSRSGVLIPEEEHQAGSGTFPETKSPKRPVRLEAEVIRFLNNDEKWIAVVGILEGKPYEIFTGKEDDSFSLPPGTEKGWVIKVKTTEGLTRYDFQFEPRAGKRETIEGLSRSFNKEYWNYAKLISGVLRQGMPLPQVLNLVETLNLYSDYINTWKSGVSRALRKFIPDGTSAADHTCAQCGDPDGIIYEEGCLKCKSCGYSLCG
jgi:ribonucleoside-diphosphate reductase alpha chain